MQRRSAQNSPQPTRHWSNHETELTRRRQLNQRSQIPSETRTETETEDLPLSAQDSEDTRIPNPPNSEDTIGLQLSLNNRRIMKAEQACFQRKTWIILFSMIVWIVLSMDEDSPQNKLENFGLIAFCCITYSLVENVIFCIKQTRARNDIKPHLLNAIDGVLVLYFLLVIKFDDGESLSKYLLILSLVLCLILVGIYFRMTKGFSVLIRGICYALQISLFAMKLLSENTLDWKIVFLPLCLYLAGHQIYGSYVLIKSSVRFYQQFGLGDLSFVRSCLRMIWDVLHYGLVFAIFGIFVNIWDQAVEKEFKESIILPLIIMQVYSGLLTTFAFFFLETVKQYDPELCEDSENGTSRLKPNESKEKYSLLPLDGLFICNFLKISPTYFVRVDEKSSQGEERENIPIRLGETDEACCYICEENQPDIIIMGCGHGGMCKECVLLSMEKNSSCMQCRKPAQSIYQIKNEDKNLGIVEACELFNIYYEVN